MGNQPSFQNDIGITNKQYLAMKNQCSVHVDNWKYNITKDSTKHSKFVHFLETSVDIQQIIQKVQMFIHKTLDQKEQINKIIYNKLKQELHSLATIVSTTSRNKEGYFLSTNGKEIVQYDYFFEVNQLPFKEFGRVGFQTLIGCSFGVSNWSQALTKEKLISLVKKSNVRSSQEDIFIKRLSEFVKQEQK